MINRRDFLKLGAMTPLALALESLTRAGGGRRLSGRQNVLVLVFDALTSRNMSLYGYGRNTTPNIDRLAKRAVVYRNHYAAANFTSPGTASILTGTYPWAHRAILLHGRMNPQFNGRSLFSAVGDYYRFAYTHNPFAFTILRPLAPHMDELVPMERLFLRQRGDLASTLLAADEDAVRVSWSRATDLEDDGSAYSLYLSKFVTARQLAARRQPIWQIFPRGVPGYEDINKNFLLETAIGWTGEKASEVPEPFLGYVHFWPPHDPYRTRVEFVDRFREDGYRPPKKPLDFFANGDGLDEDKRRREYDEFLLFVDEEFGLLYEALEAAGVLENTWLVLTSDHGESFERGLVAHGTRALYEPQVRVPLLIFEPGRQDGQEVHTATSAVDLLPTLAQVTGHAIPGWVEGVPLPPYGPDAAAQDRSLFAVMANENDPDFGLHTGTFMMLKAGYKLHYYVGYDQLAGQERVQLFDIDHDPEEMTDLASVQPDRKAAMLAELKAKIVETNDLYGK